MGRCRRVGCKLALIAFLAVHAGPLDAGAEEAAGAAPENAVEATDAAAALRAALALESAGEPAQAAEAFREVAEAHEEIADHALRLQVRSLLAADRNVETIVAAQRFERLFPDSWLRDFVIRAEGDARAREGDGAGARLAYGRALERTKDPTVRAALLVALGDSLVGSGREREAADHFRTVWSQYAATPSAPEAERALVGLEGSLGRPLRPASAWQARCSALAEARRNEAALAACDTALARAKGEDARVDIANTRARVLFRLRRYPEATDAYAALPGKEASFWHARSLARSGRIEESIEAFESLAGNPGTTRGARSLFLAATLVVDDDPPRAAEMFRRVALEAPNASQRAAARWRLGWGAYRDGHYETALRQFARVEADTADPIEQLRARYWTARAGEALERDDAVTSLADLGAAFPYTYYGWRASERVTPNGSHASATLEPGGPAAASLSSARVERIAILLGAGLDEEAAVETRQLVRTARSRADRVALADLFAAAERYHDAQRIVLHGNALVLAEGPTPDTESLFAHAWPRAYAEWVEDSSARHGIPPALLYSIMREESGYRPAVVSVVGARGLAQIMPETGRQLAQRAGWTTYDPEELFDPEKNLELSARYLAELLDRFDGRLPAAIASYNAGPRAVARWLAEDGALSDDAWVEAIPYDQTRGYVKRVLRSMVAYGELP